MHYVLVRQPNGELLAVARESRQRQASYAAKRYRINHGFIDPDAWQRTEVMVGSKAELISHHPELMREIATACKELDAALAD